MKSPSVTDSRSYFLMLARYNAWATNKLYGNIDALSEVDYRRDAGLFFKSVHGTLNHLLVAEHRVWFPRFAEGVSNRVALNEEVETDRAALRARLVEAAGRWLLLIDSFDEARFAGTLDYATTKGVAQSLPFAPTLGRSIALARMEGEMWLCSAAAGIPVNSSFLT